MCAIDFKCRRDVVVVIGEMDRTGENRFPTWECEVVQVSLRDTPGVFVEVTRQ